MSYKEKYQEWINSPIIDEETKNKLKEISNNEKEIEDSFYKELEFGTAGLRGILGVGTNRMNKYTVGKATQGLANFIIKEKGQERGVAIAYDSRNYSKEFSQIAALILNANGIKTYVFESLRPVPELSFAVRYLKCISGIMITASHNPAKYNGYKVYGEDGAQVTSPKDKQIMDEVNNIKDYAQIKTIEKEEAIKKGLFNQIGEKIDEAYINEIKKQSLNPEIIKKQENLSIVYTPLHGTGNIPVQKILNEIGFKNINIVKEQQEPDGNFPTVEYPNPEDKKAFKLALELAQKVDAQIVLATDPDADRLGVYVKDIKTNTYIPFTGNMSALIILEYILSQRKEKNTIPENGVVIKSIVSSTMAKPITQKYNVKLEEVLTGFKYIGEKIKEYEINKKYEYIFGYEESYGCLVGTHARDKDAIVAVMLLCEAAAYYKEKNMTLWDQMINMYNEYGYYKEGIKQVTLEGIDGAEKIKEIMDNFRKNPPKNFGSFKVEKIRDYNNSIILEAGTNKTEKINMPKSNVLYYELSNDSWIAVRPSGTEPKIKYYIGVKGKSIEEANEMLEELMETL